MIGWFRILYGVPYKFEVDNRQHRITWSWKSWHKIPANYFKEQIVNKDPGKKVCGRF